MRIYAPAVAVVVLFTLSGATQGPRSAARRDATARAPDGHPDLQGLWLNNTATPLERPKEFVDRPFFSDAEAATYEQTYQLDRVREATGDELFGDVGAPDLDTFEPGHVLPNRRTSLIVEPSNGRVPPLTPQAQRRIAERVARVRQHYAENPENLPNSERCLVVANTAVPPLLPNVYNNTLQIVQTPSYVAIISETIHDTRIISMGRTTHLPISITQWKGDSIGRWDGDTLVVDTTNFSDKTVFRGSSVKLHLTERFSVSSSGILAYAFAVDDADAFSQPWSAESVFTRTSDRMFEFACHEGNYSLTNTLRGARFSEKGVKDRE